MKSMYRASVLVLCCVAYLLPARATGNPPPNGFTSVAVASTTNDLHPNFGVNPRIALDANGDPMVCYLWADPNGDKDFSDSTIYFTGWSRTLNKFSPPVKVAVTGDIGGGSATVELSIARDASNNTIGIAFRKETATTEELHIALSSDSGATWKDQTIISSTSRNFRSPSLAMANGNVHLAYAADSDGIRYQTGKETDAPTLWSSVRAPFQTGYSGFRRVVSLALDGSNTPGIAYILNSDSDYDLHLVFWRPGSSSAVLISGTQNQGTDDPDIKLAFFGTQPRVAFSGAMDQNFYADFNHMLWAIRSTDNGTTWTAKVNIPSDGGRSMDPPIWLASGSQGQSAIVSYTNSGNLDGVKCGEPKLSTADATFINWTTCGPAPLRQPNFSAFSPVVAYGPGDRLYIAFQVPPGGDLPYGVALWSSAIAGGSGPSINAGGIVHGASFLAPASAGALATIFGTGFLDTATGATGVPLPKELDTPATKLTVTVNGEAAPLIYGNLTQINFQVPWDIQAGTANVVVTVNGVSSNTGQMTVIAAAPGIFVYDSTRAVVQDANYSLIDQGNPAGQGKTVIIYMTGSGPIQPAIASGEASSGTNLSLVQDSVSATVGSSTAQVVFAGMAPGFVGLLQVNIVIPTGLTPGDFPLTVTINGQKSNSPLLAVGN